MFPARRWAGRSARSAMNPSVSAVRTCTTQRNDEHHIVIPDHSPMKLGTFHGILKDVAAHHRLAVDELLRVLEL